MSGTDGNKDNTSRALLRKGRAQWLTLVLTIVLAVAFDLGSKYAAFASIGPAPVTLDAERTAELVRTDPGALQSVLPDEARRSIVTVVPYVLEFKLVLNPGAVFGSGPGMRWVFVGFTVLAIGFCVFVFLRLTKRTDWLTHVSLGLIAGGGIGNLYDRLVYACVRDFLHPLPGVEFPFGWTIMGRREIWPYVSNVADALLLIGIGYLVVKLWRHDDGGGETENAPADEPKQRDVKANGGGSD